MATVLHCSQHTAVRGRESGSRPNVYSAQWRVQLDDVVTFAEMLDLARRVPRQGDQVPVPRKGQRLRFATSVGTGNDRRTADKSALALDFSTAELLDDGRKWIVDVTWRPPAPGADEESYRVRQPPWARRPYYWIEYYSQQEEITDAQPDLPIGTGSTFRDRGRAGQGGLTTAAGEKTVIRNRERLLEVHCSQFNVIDPLLIARMNDDFGRTTNGGTWRSPVSRENVRRRRARFLRAELSQFPENYDGIEYYQAQVRVLISNVDLLERIENRGTLYVSTESGNPVKLFRDDNNAVRTVNLNRQGFIDVNNEAKPYVIPYRIYAEVDYERVLLPQNRDRRTKRRNA